MRRVADVTAARVVLRGHETGSTRQASVTCGGRKLLVGIGQAAFGLLTPSLRRNAREPRARGRLLDQSVQPAARPDKLLAMLRVRAARYCRVAVADIIATACIKVNALMLQRCCHLGGDNRIFFPRRGRRGALASMVLRARRPVPAGRRKGRRE